jgi:predicted TIM-barrel fold metal-dependent hydrolase
MKLLPTEYFERQCVISCDPDERTVHHAVDALGEDRILYASDFPHWDGEFPGSVAEIRENPKLSESAKVKILGANAGRFLKLDATA